MAGNQWPDWNKPATKGDVIRLGIHFQTALTRAAGSLVSLRFGNDDEAKMRIDEFLEIIQGMRELLNEIGGHQDDGE